jgi:acetyltransferase-like isoleucine patch superfamily enzyme
MKDCSTGANASILPNVTDGEDAIVTKNVPANSTVTNTNEIRNNR